MPLTQCDDSRYRSTKYPSHRKAFSTITRYFPRPCRLPSPTPDQHPAVPALRLLGLGSEQSDHEAQMHAGQLAQLRAIWPFALAAQVSRQRGAARRRTRRSSRATALPVGIVVAIAALLLPVARRLCGARRVATARLAAARPHPLPRSRRPPAPPPPCSLLWASTRLPISPVQLGCFVARSPARSASPRSPSTRSAPRRSASAPGWCDARRSCPASCCRRWRRARLPRLPRASPPAARPARSALAAQRPRRRGDARAASRSR